MKNELRSSLVLLLVCVSLSAEHDISKVGGQQSFSSSYSSSSASAHSSAFSSSSSYGDADKIKKFGVNLPTLPIAHSGATASASAGGVSATANAHSQVGILASSLPGASIGGADGSNLQTGNVLHVSNEAGTVAGTNFINSGSGSNTHTTGSSGITNIAGNCGATGCKNQGIPANASNKYSGESGGYINIDGTAGQYGQTNDQGGPFNCGPLGCQNSYGINKQETTASNTGSSGTVPFTPQSQPSSIGENFSLVNVGSSNNLGHASNINRTTFDENNGRYPTKVNEFPSSSGTNHNDVYQGHNIVKPDIVSPTIVAGDSNYGSSNTGSTSNSYGGSNADVSNFDRPHYDNVHQGQTVYDKGNSDIVHSSTVAGGSTYDSSNTASTSGFYGGSNAGIYPTKDNGFNFDKVHQSRPIPSVGVPNVAIPTSQVQPSSTSGSGSGGNYVSSNTGTASTTYGVNNIGSYPTDNVNQVPNFGKTSGKPCCKGPFPGPNGNINDFKPVSTVTGITRPPPLIHVGSGNANVDSILQKPVTSTCCKGPYPGPSGSIYDSKPVSVVGTAFTQQPAVSWHSKNSSPEYVDSPYKTPENDRTYSHVEAPLYPVEDVSLSSQYNPAILNKPCIATENGACVPMNKIDLPKPGSSNINVPVEVTLTPLHVPGYQNNIPNQNIGSVPVGVGDTLVGPQKICGSDNVESCNKNKAFNQFGGNSQHSATTSTNIIQSDKNEQSVKPVMNIFSFPSIETTPEHTGQQTHTPEILNHVPIKVEETMKSNTASGSNSYASSSSTAGSNSFTIIGGGLQEGKPGPSMGFFNYNGKDQGTSGSQIAAGHTEGTTSISENSNVIKDSHVGSISSGNDKVIFSHELQPSTISFSAHLPAGTVPYLPPTQLQNEKPKDGNYGDFLFIDKDHSLSHHTGNDVRVIYPQTSAMPPTQYTLEHKPAIEFGNFQESQNEYDSSSIANTRGEASTTNYVSHNDAKAAVDDSIRFDGPKTKSPVKSSYEDTNSGFATGVVVISKPTGSNDEVISFGKSDSSSLLGGSNIYYHKMNYNPPQYNPYPQKPCGGADCIHGENSNAASTAGSGSSGNSQAPCGSGGCKHPTPYREYSNAVPYTGSGSTGNSNSGSGTYAQAPCTGCNHHPLHKEYPHVVPITGTSTYSQGSKENGAFNGNDAYSHATLGAFTGNDGSSGSFASSGSQAGGGSYSDPAKVKGLLTTLFHKDAFGNNLGFSGSKSFGNSGAFANSFSKSSSYSDSSSSSSASSYSSAGHY